MNDCGRLIGAHLNIRSSSTCFAEFKDCVEESGIDIIGLTETWPNDGSELIVKMEGFSFVCNNRVTRGGGTGIYIKDDSRDLPGIGNRTLFADIEDIVMASLPVAECVVVVGDFNVDFAKYDSPEYTAYINCLQNFDLMQLVNKPTRKDAILDHIITNKPNIFEFAGIPL
ncbi:hypothetical protein HHI36_023992 [Cryptolaemus montrouzieri]|uniref:Endonuclease/exonuclease/phosphatase domain-containing protein n=1 Tax=Cryptolaemus montrouzieri TaxID=559131 RepID=A0ABD2N0X5_9CUCU